MIEKICPKCRVPMTGDKCIKQSCGCNTEVSTTIYWCEDCNIPIFDKICSICEGEGRYISTDLRPVFPEENMLVSSLCGWSTLKSIFVFMKCRWEKTNRGTMLV